MPNPAKRPARAGEPMLPGQGLEPDRITAVLDHARESGLISNKDGRISGRVSPRLIERAKARTGLASDTALVEFALANIAVEDDFARVFRDLQATVDPDLVLDFRR